MSLMMIDGQKYKNQKQKTRQENKEIKKQKKNKTYKKNWWIIRYQQSSNKNIGSA